MCSIYFSKRQTSILICNILINQNVKMCMLANPTNNFNLFNKEFKALLGYLFLWFIYK